MNLDRRILLGDLDLTDYPFSIEFEEDHGTAENVYDVLVSLLSDGEIATSTRVGNREITVTVLVEGPTLADLAIYEAQLVAECEKPQSTLTLDPGDDYASASVFDTFRVQARLLYDAGLEQSTFRRYELTIPAWPYPRGATTVVTSATASTPTYTVVDNGSALSGGGFSWALITTDSTTLSIVSGKVQVAYSGAGTSVRAVQRAGTVSLTGKRYIVFDAAATVPITGLQLLNTGLLHSLAATMDLGGGTFRYFFSVPEGTASIAGFTLAIRGTWTSGKTFSIDQVQTSDSIPFLGTARQKAMSLVPGGSVRTSGSIQISHASNALGTTIVYTHPSGTGYLPPLRPWRVSGDAVTSDSTMLSGARNNLTGITTFNVPEVNLPRGGVEVWAWLHSSSAGTFTMFWSLFSYMGSTQLSAEGRTTSITLPATTWTLKCLGATTMPPVDIGPAGYVSVQMQRDAASGLTIQLDEAYLFATDYGRLTIVDCGTGSPAAGAASNRLWIDAPTPANPNGGLYRGNASDRSDQWHAGGVALPWQVHDFDPAGMNVFVATQNTIDASTSLEHYRRWHTHNGDLP